METIVTIVFFGVVLVVLGMAKRREVKYMNRYDDRTTYQS